MYYPLASTGILLAKLALGAYSLIALAIVIERWLAIRWTVKQENDGYKAVATAFRSRVTAVALDHASRYESPSCIALMSAAESLNRLPQYALGAGEQEFIAQATHMQRGLRTVASIASTAPYVGLFGTVLGILAAFHTIASTGQTGASIVAGGITEALITTAMGLGVAVPSVIAYNWLSGKVNDVTLTAERHARELIAYLLADVESKETRRA